MKWVALLLTLAACGDDAGPPDARVIDATPPGGTISLTWSISDDAGPLTCQQVLARDLHLTLTATDQVFSISDILDCSAFAGTTRTVLPGTYNIQVGLGGVAVPAITFQNIVVRSGQDTAIGDAAFLVDAHGGFTFQVGTGGAGNCVDVASGGAGITQMQLALATAGGTCVPVTFDFSGGGSYTNDCANSAPTRCIEGSETVSVAPTLATGTYRMTITGFDNADACWATSPQFDVPAAGVVKALPLQNLVEDTNNPNCP
jgi:hypothetical protein